MTNRKLTLEQKRVALTQAKHEGLCDGWHVEWDNRRKSKVWIAPGGVKTCWSLPQAVAWQIKAGVAEPSSVPTNLAHKLHRKLTKEEVDVAQAEAKRKGLPGWWRLEYDNRRGCKAWISPCGSRRCYTVGKAVAWSLGKGLVRLDQLPPAQSAMSEDEIAAARRVAKERGLSDEWKVEWNYRKGSVAWINPQNGRRYISIAEALRQQNSGDDAETKETRIPSKPSVTAGKGSSAVDDLPAGWTMEWDDATNQNAYWSPRKDRKCHSIKEVLTWTLKTGLLHAETCQSSVQKKQRKSQLGEEEKRKALELAKSQGLGDGWIVEWDSKSMQRVWYAPNRRKKCQSLPEALAWAAKNTLGPDKICVGSHTTSESDECVRTGIAKSSNKLVPVSSSAKRCSPAISESEIEVAAKIQKRDDPVLCLDHFPATTPATNTIKPMAATSAGPCATSILCAYPYDFGPTTGQHHLLSRSLLAGWQHNSLPFRLDPSSLSLSHASSSHISPFGLHHSNRLVQDLLALRSEQMRVSNNIQRELLLEAALRRSSAPSSMGYPFFG